MKREVVQSSVEAFETKEEMKLRAIFASSPNAITVSDLNGNIMDCNQATLDLHGYSSKEELIGKSALKLIARKDHQRALENLKKTLEQSSVREIEYTFLTKNGREFPAELSASVIKDSSGNPIGFVAITNDIAERKRAEEALRESETKFRNIFESANDCMIYLDRSGRILDVNRKAVEVFGGSKKELLGKHFTRLGIFSLRETPTLMSNFANIFVDKKATINIRIKNKRGQEIPLECSASLMKTEDTSTVMVVARDVTERKIMEERIAYLASIVNNAKVAIATVDMNGIVRSWNKAAEEMLGWASKEAIEKPMPRFCPNAGKQIDATIKEGFCLDKELDYIKKDGKSILCSTSTFLMKDKDGDPVGVGGIAIDITERKKAEEKVRESEERYRVLVESAADAIFTLNEAGDFLSANQEAAKSMGKTPEDLIGKNMYDLFPKDIADRQMSSVKAVFQTGNPLLANEAPTQTEYGQRWYGTTLMPVRDSHGKIIYVVGFSRDITERKQMEERYRDLVEKEKDIIYTLDAEGDITFVSPAVETILGYQPEEVQGKNFMGLIPKEWLKKTLIDFNNLLKTGDITAETVLLDNKGRPHFVEYSSTVIKEGNKVVGTRGIVRDVTERKEMEEKVKEYSEHLEELVQKRTQELLESEKRYSVLVEEASDGVIILQDGKIVFTNKKGLEIVGYSRDDAIGLPFERLVDEKHHQIVNERYKRRLRGEEVPATYEIEVIAKTGQRVPVELSATRINYQGHPASLVIVRDIRERKRMEEERLVLERLATIGEIATMVGHDLRNPLQSIENATYYLNNELQRFLPSTPQKTTEMLQILNNSVDYADRIIRDLQDFSATKKPILKKTNINTIVKETLSQLKTPENLKLITKLGHLPKIKADKDMIKRVFLNLATNAIQAMEKGGTLKIATKETKGFVEVSFRDTGVGISKENMERLFTPFFTTKAKGMGMGLSICKRFVDAHGGSIEAKSEEGKGSTFTVKLPIQQENGGEKA